MASSTMVSKGTSEEHTQLSLNRKERQSSNRTRYPKTPPGSKENDTTGGLGSFRRKLLAKELTENAASLISNTRKTGTINHYESSWGERYSW